MYKPNLKLIDSASDIHVPIQSGGKSVGALDLNVRKLWTMIKPDTKDPCVVEWMQAQRYNRVIRAAVILKMVNRLKPQICEMLAGEIDQARNDLEGFRLKSEAAAATFGRKQKDIERLVAESNCSLLDFYSFFWKYLIDDQDSIAVREKWDLLRNA